VQRGGVVFVPLQLLGDGLLLVAVPLLAAELTSSAVLVALTVLSALGVEPAEVSEFAAAIQQGIPLSTSRRLPDGEIKAGLDVYAAGYPLGDPEFTLTTRP